METIWWSLLAILLIVLVAQQLAYRAAVKDRTRLEEATGWSVNLKGQVLDPNDRVAPLSSYPYPE